MRCGGLFDTISTILYRSPSRFFLVTERLSGARNDWSKAAVRVVFSIRHVSLHREILPPPCAPDVLRLSLLPSLFFFLPFSTVLYFFSSHPVPSTTLDSTARLISLRERGKPTVRPATPVEGVIPGTFASRVLVTFI